MSSLIPLPVSVESSGYVAVPLSIDRGLNLRNGAAHLSASDAGPL